MELGKLPTQRVEDIKIADQKKLTVIIFPFIFAFIHTYYAIYSHSSEDASTSSIVLSSQPQW